MKHLLAACVVVTTICCCQPAERHQRSDRVRRSMGAPPPPDGVAGLLMGSPLGITDNQRSDIAIKLAGFTPGAPQNWPSTLPRPAFETLVSTILAPTGVTASSPILAMSLGLDVIVVDARNLRAGEWLDGGDGEGTPVAILTIAGHGWYAIEFSVDGDLLQQSDDLAPDIASAHAAGEVDASVFSYVLPGSDLELLPIEEESVRSLTPASLGLVPGQHRIQALNMHMGLYHTNLTLYPNVFTQRPLPQDVWVYFTLQPGLVTKYGNQIASGWNVPQPDSGVIYKTHWVNNGWSVPQVYRTWTQLGIPPVAGTHNPIVDGLAIDTKGTDSESDDEILFSLAHTNTFDVPAAMQMQYAGPVQPPPRRVIVRLPDDPDHYGSLGNKMKGGRGIGDFCTGDPWNVTKLGMRELVSLFLPDDFFIARRLRSDEVHVRPAELQVPLAMANLVDRQRRLARLLTQGYLAYIPDGGDAVAVPELALAISGFRQQGAEQPVMRACFSWPRPDAIEGQATIHWGTTDNVFADAPTFVWDPTPVPRAYDGTPFSLDRPLLGDGLLRPAPQTSPGQHTTKALVVKWTLVTDTGTYISPIAALRY